MHEGIFTVASFNIRGGYLTLQIAEEMEELLAENSVDFAGLQEVDHLSFRSGRKDFLKVFRRGEYKYSSFSPAQSLVMGKTYGNATVSKFELIESEEYQLPYPFKTRRLSVERRVVTRNLIKVKDVEVAFFNTHLCLKDLYRDEVLVRRLQIEYIVKLLEKEKAEYKIVIGDFNVSNYEEFYIFKEKGYNLVNDKSNEYLTFNGDIKHRGNKKFRGIDNIIFTNNLSLLNGNMVETKLSDHNPLIAKFKISDC